MKHCLFMKRCLQKTISFCSLPVINKSSSPVKLLFIVTSLLFFNSNLLAQRTISGKVTSENNQPLAGVTVAVQGKTASAVTNENGVFSISANTGDVLVFTSAEYKQFDATVGSANTVNVTLTSLVTEIEEVVMVGYGSQKRKDITSSTVTLKTDIIPKSANASINNVIQGRAPGLNLDLRSAQPGGRLNVSIRGRGTPLYVIDGVPLFNYNSAEPSIVSFGSAVETGFNGGIDRDPLSNMNPSDIESVDILKDASATAIYGSAASNGVILITTKKGKASNGVLTTEYRGSYTVQSPKKYFDLLNAQEFMQEQVRLSRDRALYLANAAPYGTSPTPAFTPLFTQAQIDAAGEGTDWLDILMRNGTIQEHNISIAGGTDRVRVFSSFNYYDNKAIVENSDFTRFTGRINLDLKLNERIKLSTQLQVSQINSNNQSTGNGGNSEKFNSLQTAYAFAPYLEIYDAAGKYTKTLNTQITNPAAFLIIQDKLRTKRFFAAPNLEIKIIKGLTFNLVGGIDKVTSDRRFFLPAAAQNYLFPGGLAQISSASLYNYSVEGYATYNKTISNHNLSVVLGSGYYKSYNETFSMQGADFFTDALGYNNIGLATNRDKTLMMSNRTFDFIKISEFLRVNYSYKSKYILTINARGDASSNFPDQKWGFFPGVSGAWRISEESFLSASKIISDLKLRVGYGKVGVDPGLTAVGLYGTGGGTFLIGSTTYPSVALTQLSNPDLSWETLTNINIGIDYGLWKDRITGALELFRNDRSDIIRGVQLPYNNAVLFLNTNKGGSQRTQGVEFSVNSKNLTGKLRWETSFNISTYNNRWLERSPYDALNQFQKVDERTDIVYGWGTNGIIRSASDKPAYMPNARLGNVIYVDQDKNNVLDINDVVVLGYSTPKWSWGFGNRFSFMNFDLDIFMYGRIKQNLANNLSGFYAADRLGIPAGQNTLTDIKNVWTADNPSGTLPGIASNPYAVPTGAASNFYRQNVNYMRFRNITLGYTFNVKKIIHSARLYVDVQNVGLWTNYKGYDPEIAVGNEGNPYPQTLSTTVGLSIGF